MNWDTIIGMTAAILTTAAYVPQAIKSIRLKSTGDISLIMYISLNAGIILWLVYGIALSNLPIVLANSITIIFTGTILFMKIRYK